MRAILSAVAAVPGIRWALAWSALATVGVSRVVLAPEEAIRVMPSPYAFGSETYLVFASSDHLVGLGTITTDTVADGRWRQRGQEVVVLAPDARAMLRYSILAPSPTEPAQWEWSRHEATGLKAERRQLFADTVALAGKWGTRNLLTYLRTATRGAEPWNGSLPNIGMLSASVLADAEAGTRPPLMLQARDRTWAPVRMDAVRPDAACLEALPKKLRRVVSVMPPPARCLRYASGADTTTVVIDVTGRLLQWQRGTTWRIALPDSLAGPLWSQAPPQSENRAVQHVVMHSMGFR